MRLRKAEKSAREMDRVLLHVSAILTDNKDSRVEGPGSIQSKQLYPVLCLINIASEVKFSACHTSQLGAAEDVT